MNKGSILILGGKSDIGIALAHKFAKEGYNVQLSARNVKFLRPEQKNIQIRYSVRVTLYEFDAINIKSHDEFISSLDEIPMIAVSAVGYMGDQKDSEQNVKKASLIFRSNFEGPASVFSILANRFIERKSGTLIGISSVAGDRGKASNYIYGSAKSGFTTFLSGMRNRLNPYNINVITVLPGYVDTKMTKDLKLPKNLTASPEKVADTIFLCFLSGKDIVYVLSIWRIIMMIICMIPEKFFKKISL